MKTRIGAMQDFDQIVKEYSLSIYNFVYRLSGDKDETPDLAQEVFLKVWKNMGKFDQQKSFKTWIFSIARNTVIDWFRKKKSLNFSALQADEEDHSFEDALADIEPLPDEVFRRKELVSELENAMAHLTPHQKTVIFLHHTEDLTFEEISEVIKKPMNTVKSQYRRALLELKGLLLAAHR